MKDLIERQAAIDAILEMNTEHRVSWLDCAIDTLDTLPSVQPEIIRCKDCKYWMPYDWMFSELWRSQNIYEYAEEEKGCRYCDMDMRANDFCSRAERKE